MAELYWIHMELPLQEEAFKGYYPIMTSQCVCGFVCLVLCVCVYVCVCVCVRVRVRARVLTCFLMQQFSEFVSHFRFLYQQLKYFFEGDFQKTIFVGHQGSPLVTLREGITFHLYLNQAPEGDAARYLDQ